jgi:hypothetical protein
VLLINQSTKTIIDGEGKTIFFGLEDFKEKIIKENNCFICGAQPSSKKFNNEHIIPDWILKKYNLHSKSITLPNLTKIRYGQYVIPCCSECNKELGNTYELPISRLFRKSYEDICYELKNDYSLFKLLYRWLHLIFLKTHLKDNLLPKDRNPNQSIGNIGDDHYWEDIHHIHCIARSHYSNAKIESEVFGTLCILPAIKLNNSDNFDYIDSQIGKTIMLQLDEVCIIGVLNDSGGSYSILSNMINKITNKLDPLQIRELVAHFNFVNLNLKERPTYQSLINTKEYKIKAVMPENSPCLIKEEERILSPGDFLEYYANSMIGNIENREIILDELKTGKRNFLFDEKGNFINNNL